MQVITKAVVQVYRIPASSQHYVDIPIELLEQYLAGLLYCESRQSDDASFNIKSILKKHCITMYLNHSLSTSINVLVFVHFSA